MADLSGVTSVTINRKEDANGMRVHYVTIVVGDGSSTYGSANGISLTKGELGMARAVNSFTLSETGTMSYNVEYDISAEKLRLGYADYTNTTDGPFIELASTETPAAQTLRVKVEGY